MSKKASTNEFVFKTLCFSLLFLLLLQPKISVEMLKNSAEYAINSVAPAIFPYMVMAYLISTGRFSTIIGFIFYPITGYLLKVKSKKAGTAIFVALIGGFAAAAVVLSRLIENNDINKCEARRLFPIILIPSVPFMILVVGKVIFNSYEIGGMLSFAIVLANLITAIVLSIGKKTSKKSIYTYEQELRLGDHITTCIRTATLNTLYICGFISFFGMLSGLIQLSLPRVVAMIITLTLEFSTALIYTNNNIYLVLLTLSLLGICSYFQLALILKENASLKLFTISRIITSFSSFLILKIIFYLFPIDIMVFSSMDKMYILPYQYNIELSILVFLIIIISFTDFISKKGLH